MGGICAKLNTGADAKAIDYHLSSLKEIMTRVSEEAKLLALAEDLDTMDLLALAEHLGFQMAGPASTGMADHPAAGMSDSPAAGMADHPAAGMSDSPAAGISDLPAAGISDLPTSTVAPTFEWQEFFDANGGSDHDSDGDEAARVSPKLRMRYPQLFKK
eukprot:4142293-Pleurochrysis_carterae.AAC.1